MKKINHKKVIEKNLGKGLVPDVLDDRDKRYEDIVAAGPVMTDAEWKQGFDIEKELKIKIPFKNQCSSLSCVGQGFAYQLGVINAKEVGFYDETSAKGIYSQIFLPNGGAQLRDAAKLAVNFGALLEKILTSYRNPGITDENFMCDKSWLNPKMIKLAQNLQAKEYRSMSGLGIDYFARAIKDNWGCVGGVAGQNNGTWNTNEPKPPVSNPSWYHCLYFGKFGVDEKGKYIATPNSWGTRNEIDPLHPDDWQKLREDYFKNRNQFIINPWTFIDKPNVDNVPKKIAMTIIKKQGEATLYIAAGEILIPFNTSFEIYQKDFAAAKIVELPAVEFAKFTVAAGVAIKTK